jgi:hypothetical protein
MTQDEEDPVDERVYREYRAAKEALAALEASLEEIVGMSSLTTDEGYWMYSPSAFRLHETDYVREQVAQYRAVRRHKEALRKRLIDLGEPDPE